MVGIYEGLGTCPVNQPGDARGKGVDGLHSIFREDSIGMSKVGELLFNVGFGLGKLIRGQKTLDVNPVEDRPVRLQAQLLPKFGLPSQDQCKRVFGVHLVVEQKADFLQHLLGKQMAFVHNYNEFPVSHAAHNLNLVV